MVGGRRRGVARTAYCLSVAAGDGWGEGRCEMGSDPNSGRRRIRSAATSYEFGSDPISRSGKHLAAKPGPGRPRRTCSAVGAGRTDAPAFVRSRGPSPNSLRSPKGAPLGQCRRVRARSALTRAAARSDKRRHLAKVRRGPPDPDFAEAQLPASFSAHQHCWLSRQALPGGSDLSGGCDARPGDGARLGAHRPHARRRCSSGARRRGAQRVRRRRFQAGQRSEVQAPLGADRQTMSSRRGAPGDDARTYPLPLSREGDWLPP